MSKGEVTADGISGVGGVLIPGVVVKSFGSLPTAAAAKDAAKQAGEAAAKATASVFPTLAPAAGKEAARQSAAIVSGVESATKQVVS